MNKLISLIKRFLKIATSSLQKRDPDNTPKLGMEGGMEGNIVYYIFEYSTWSSTKTYGKMYTKPLSSVGRGGGLNLGK